MHHTTLQLGERRQATREALEERTVLPTWFKALFLGLGPSIACGYLLHALVSGIVPAMIKNNELLLQHMAQMDNLGRDLSSIKSQNETLIQINRANCVNNAKTREDRDLCEGMRH